MIRRRKSDPGPPEDGGHKPVTETLRFKKHGYTAVGNRHADHVAPSNRKNLAITSPTSDGRSVGIVRSRTQTMQFFFVFLWAISRCVIVMHIFYVGNLVPIAVWTGKGLPVPHLQFCSPDPVYCCHS
jgi:hypothetical protein